MAFSVELTDYAVNFIEEHVTYPATLSRIEQAVGMLAAFPAMGLAYEPEYMAARPPFACRYLPLSDTPFTLYYLKDDAAERVVVFDIEWTAGDPTTRFAEFEAF